MFFRKLNYYTLLCTLSLFSATGTLAQKTRDNSGTDFWLTILENYTSPANVSFSVSNESFPNTVTLKCGVYTRIYNIYRKDTILNYTGSTVPQAGYFVNKSINISSTRNISVYALNNSLNSSDLASIIPSAQVPYNPVYFGNTYRGGQESSSNNCSELSIVAIDDSCYINVLPTASTTNFDPKDTLIRRWLRKGELYWLQAQDSQSFAGTKVWNTYGCKRFVVFEGAKCSRVIYDPGCSGCDHLFNQSRPVQYQGLSFTSVPYTNISKGYLLQVVAANNNTTLYINGSFVKTMAEREVYVKDVSDNSIQCVTSDKKISVIQIMKSGICNGSNLGNPSIMTVLPDNQYAFKARFALPVTKNLGPSVSNPAEFFLGIVCPKGKLYQLRLNNATIDTSVFSIKCDKAVGSIPIVYSTAYEVQSASGFLAYIYANGYDESYATEIGSGFENPSASLTMRPDVKFICDSMMPLTFLGQSDSSAIFKWNFGDATNATGDSVVKIYNKTGKFNIQMTVQFPNNNGCKSDTFTRSVDIYRRPVFTLGKDTNLCIGQFFTLAPFVAPKSKFKWSDGSTNNVYNISGSAAVALTITDSNLCTYTDSIDLNFINCDTNSIKIPNVFTPGEIDDLNDNFEIEYTGFDKIEGVIYNRWGVPVYRFEYPVNGFWNGGYKNDIASPCPAGTYFYIFRFVNSVTNLTREVNGTVQLIR